MSNALKAAAELVLQFAPSQECTRLAEYVLSELAATADDEAPLTVERCVEMGGVMYQGPVCEFSFDSDHSLMVHLDDYTAILNHRGYWSHLPGTYRTVGALRRLLAALKGD